MCARMPMATSRASSRPRQASARSSAKSATRCQAPEEFIEGEKRGHRIRRPHRQRALYHPRRTAPLPGRCLSDEITGAVIVYNNLTDVFTVDGQKKATPSADGQTGGGRVRAVLAPKEPAAGAAAPAAPASGPALRPQQFFGWWQPVSDRSAQAAALAHPPAAWKSLTWPSPTAAARW